MERWFDLHLYLANWGSRRLMIRVPARFIDRDRLDAVLGEADCVQHRVVGENLILDIARDEMEFEDWDDGSGWLAALTPLRAELLSGNQRLFYLLWLMAVEAEAIDADDPEPMPGIGPMTGALEAFANFFGIEPDLVEAAAERSDAASEDRLSSDGARQVIASMPDREKTALLMRLFDGDPYVAAELRAGVRKNLDQGAETPTPARRTVRELQARAHDIRLARERAAAEKAAEERRRQTEAAERARQARLEAIQRRGDSVWQEIEEEIERRNAAGYDKAAALLSDLKVLAEQLGTTGVFLRRLLEIRERHARKGRFIERVAAIG